MRLKKQIGEIGQRSWIWDRKWNMESRSTFMNEIGNQMCEVGQRLWTWDRKWNAWTRVYTYDNETESWIYFRPLFNIYDLYLKHSFLRNVYCL